MRYKIITISICAVVALITAYFAADSRVITNPMTANHIIYDNLEQLDQAIDLIVLAKATGKRDNVVHGQDLMSSYGYTMTEISIEKVLKNETNEEISPGDQMKISEPYYIFERGVIPGKVKNIYSEYSDIMDDTSYVLYLKWYKGSNSYSVHSLNQGKYNIDGKDINENKIIEHSTAKKIKEEVLQKYKSEIGSLE